MDIGLSVSISSQPSFLEIQYNAKSKTLYSANSIYIENLDKFQLFFLEVQQDLLIQCYYKK
jgi:hypothetical protein